MTRQINLQNKKIEYILKTSRRAKRMRLAVYCDSSFVVTKPIGLSESIVEKFITQKADWILSKLKYFKKFKNSQIKTKDSRENYLKYKNAAFELVNTKIVQLNKIYNFRFNRISIRNQKTRWGSCSMKGNMNFNYKILFLSEYIANYIVAHELCHLEEFNHSRKFWNLVAKTIPNYLDIKRELKREEINYF
ncbi:MAG: YgjP-like metallopeptidase domain-containing protein [Patescibacteria group bacterium]|nr:YgjP-like metallopeptidase domain-containing protein [Patescibacteria group bacterium]